MPDQGPLDSPMEYLGTRDSADSEAPETFDFSRTDRMSAEHRKALLGVHERFARNATLNLSAFLGTSVNVAVSSILQSSFGQFCGSVKVPTCCFCMGFRPSSQRALVDLSLEVAVPLLELLLGGAPSVTLQTERELTEIEFELLQSLFSTVVQDYTAAWEGMAEIACAVENTGSDPVVCGAMQSHESVAVIQFEIGVGDASGRMSVVIPITFLRSLRQDFGPQKPVVATDSTPASRAGILRRIESTQVNVEAQLSGLSISMEEVMGLVPGDVIDLNHPSGEPIRLSIGGREKYWGKITVSNGKRGFSMLALAAPPESLVQ